MLICLLVRLSVCMSLYLFVCLFVCVFVCLLEELTKSDLKFSGRGEEKERFHNLVTSSRQTCPWLPEIVANRTKYRYKYD